MAVESSKQKTKICPTCGTRMNESATRCLVCGRTFSSEGGQTENAPKKGGKNVSAMKKPRLPEIRLSLPVAIGLFLLIMGMGAIMVFFMLRTSGRVVDPTATATSTATATISPTPTITYTPTMELSATPIAPIEYTVKEGDLCASIAALFNISVASIVQTNNLSASCFLAPGMVLQIPHPTPTVTPMATNTLTGLEATLAYCGSYDHLVTNNDTLFGIALNYGVTTDIIKQYNGLTNDIVVSGATIKIPLCEQVTPGPTSTPTNPPPYPAPNPLLPADGTSYNTSGETITLQWAGVGTLLENEAYEVEIEDITEGAGRKLTAYVSDTKYIVPVSFRPRDPAPHIIRWSISTVRQIGSQADGTPIYASAGGKSGSRDFIWSGVAIQ